MFLTIPVIDCLYIYLYHQQRKALVTAAPKEPVST
jgi:hypothetical protein